jgi:16S rRNA (cytosine967-C5)-methyltransferase
MRLHRNLVYTIDSLNAIFNGEYADKVARALKKDKRWSSDRKFVAETIYEVVRWKDYMLKYEVKEPLTEIILRMFSVWLWLYTYSDWRQLEGTPERK